MQAEAAKTREPTEAEMDRALPFPPLTARRAYTRACRLALKWDERAAFAEVDPATDWPAHVMCAALWRAYDRLTAA